MMPWAWALSATDLDAPGIFRALVVVAVIAVAAPILVSLVPRLRIPAVVVEVVLGAVVGPGGLGVIAPNAATEVLSFLGLGYLLFVAGLEIEPESTTRHVRSVSIGFALSVVIGIGIAFGIAQVEPISQPVLVGFALSSTSLGVIVAIMRDAGLTQTDFGHLAVASGSFGEFGSLLLIAIFFSAESGSVALRAATLVVFGVVVVAGGFVMSGLLRFQGLTVLVSRLRGGSAQLDMRLAMLVLIAFAGLAGTLGFEGILGCFAAGALIRVVDHRGLSRNPQFMAKVDAIGYGFLIPVFFIASGIALDFRSLFDSPRHFLLIPLFFLGFLLSRGASGLLSVREIGWRRAGALGLLQATTLTVIVVVVDLALALHVLDEPAATALLAAALLSELVFPPLALTLLEGTRTAS